MWDSTSDHEISFLLCTNLQVLLSASFTFDECVRWAGVVCESVLMQALLVDPLFTILLLSFRLFIDWVLVCNSSTKKNRSGKQSILPKTASNDVVEAKPARVVPKNTNAVEWENDTSPKHDVWIASTACAQQVVPYEHDHESIDNYNFHTKCSPKKHNPDTQHHSRNRPIDAAEARLRPNKEKKEIISL